MFTREWRYDVYNCDVLITVPECLEILLLSPAREVRKRKHTHTHNKQTVWFRCLIRQQHVERESEVLGQQLRDCTHTLQTVMTGTHTQTHNTQMHAHAQVHGYRVFLVRFATARDSTRADVAAKSCARREADRSPLRPRACQHQRSQTGRKHKSRPEAAGHRT